MRLGYIPLYSYRYNHRRWIGELVRPIVQTLGIKTRLYSVYVRIIRENQSDTLICLLCYIYTSIA